MRLYGYLNQLASGPSDFSFAVANERRRITEEAKARQFKEKAAIFRSRFNRTAL